ncbi:MAG: membrane protein insertase YidC [Lachnospiraceae bacterium]|nr:membrane protein insertase YidC [Lachnospiraceae bacterium]
MERISEWIAVPLGAVMDWCYGFLMNYGWAILLFTLISKIILLPISVWVQKNSIKMVEIQPAVNRIRARYYGDADTIAEKQAEMYKEKGYHPMASLVPLFLQIVILMGVVAVIRGRIAGGQEMHFLGFDLTLVPSEALGKMLVIPFVAALSAAALCIAQNRSNVLQHEQSKVNQWGMSIFSIGLSLFLGFFVPGGIGLYWIASNLLAVLQLYLLNLAIPPKKYVDYEELEASRKALGELDRLNSGQVISKEDKAREKADYKRFFSINNKHLVFYSERSGFYRYYKDIIGTLLKKTSVRIHYVTNDPKDQIFELAKTEPRILPYYISVRKMVTLMMRLECDIFVMTTPDLENFYLKRSLMKKDIEYIYVPHDPASSHMGFREHALDHFDTVFMTGPHIRDEVRAAEKLYGTKEKTLVEFGYPLMDELVEGVRSLPEKKEGPAQILIAPSWQEDNLLDSCADELIRSLYAAEYKVIVRPHPEYAKRWPDRLQLLKERYAAEEGERLVFEYDFSAASSVYSSDLLITDWSGIGIEFGLATGRPVLFVNTKMKVENPNWEALGIVPQEIRLRSVLGRAVEKSEAAQADKAAAELLAAGRSEEKAAALREQYFYHPGTHGLYGARYLIGRLTNKKQ